LRIHLNFGGRHLRIHLHFGGCHLLHMTGLLSSELHLSRSRLKNLCGCVQCGIALLYGLKNSGLGFSNKQGVLLKYRNIKLLIQVEDAYIMVILIHGGDGRRPASRRRRGRRCAARAPPPFQVDFSRSALSKRSGDWSRSVNRRGGGTAIHGA
jgi:hypothetical protein